MNFHYVLVVFILHLVTTKDCVSREVCLLIPFKKFAVDHLYIRVYSIHFTLLQAKVEEFCREIGAGLKKGLCNLYELVFGRLEFWYI